MLLVVQEREGKKGERRRPQTNKGERPGLHTRQEHGQAGRVGRKEATWGYLFGTAVAEGRSDRQVLELPRPTGVSASAVSWLVYVFSVYRAAGKEGGVPGVARGTRKGWKVAEGGRRGSRTE